MAPTATTDKSGYQPGSAKNGSPPVLQSWLDKHPRNTRRAYEQDARLWTTWCSRRGIDPLNARRAQCNDFASWLAVNASEATNKVRSKRTQARILAALASLYEYILDRDDDDARRNPWERVSRPTVKRRSGTTKALSKADTAAVLKAAEEMGGRAYVAVAVMLDTAVRADGLLHVRIEDLLVEVIEGDDGEERHRLVAEFVLKGGDIHRVPLSNAAADDVDRLKGERTEGYLFEGRKSGTAWSYESLHETVVAIGQRAGVKIRVTPHVLRATWATIALSAGLSPEYVRSVMGHQSIDTTLGYDRNRDDLKRRVEAVDRVSEIIRRAAA